MTEMTSVGDDFFEFEKTINDLDLLTDKQIDQLEKILKDYE